eukprot:Em0007g817a
MVHMYGVFTSASYGPQGSAVCVFSYGAASSDITGVFQTTSFVNTDFTAPYYPLLQRTSSGSNDAVTSASPLLSAVVTQAQGINPIFSALGYTFMRIVVDQVTALDSVMYDVMFIAAFSGNKLLLLKMTYVTRRVDSAQYTSRVIPVGTSAEWVVQMSLSTSPLRPKAVYLATNSKLTVIPVDDCGAYANCTDCVGARDPYCAFNMITMTCTSLPSAPSRLMFRQDVVAGNAKSLCPPIRGVTQADTQTTSASSTTTATSDSTWTVVAAIIDFVLGSLMGSCIAVAIFKFRGSRLQERCFRRLRQRKQEWFPMMEPARSCSLLMPELKMHKAPQ